LETTIVGGPRDKDVEREEGGRQLHNEETDPNNMSRKWIEDRLSDKGIFSDKKNASYLLWALTGFIRGFLYEG
jgi:hypothetical protein